MNDVINPKIDIVFKNIFGKKGNEDLLEDLLSSILAKNVKCKEVIREARIGGLKDDEKYGSLDVKAVLENNEEVDIEMQINLNSNLPKRMVYYASTLTVESLKRKQSYTEMNQKIIIFLTDKNFYEYEEAINETEIVLKNHKDKVFTDIHKFYIVEIPKLKNIDNSKLVRWEAFLNQNKEMLKIMKKEDKIIKKAEEELEYLTGDAEVRRLAELRQKAIREERDAILNGRAEGRAKGRAEGRAEGKIEERKNIAKSLLNKNIDITIISEVTNLSIDDINNL